MCLAVSKSSFNEKGVAVASERAGHASLYFLYVLVGLAQLRFPRAQERTLEQENTLKAPSN